MKSIIVSDLFQSPYDHTQRMVEQEILCHRLEELNDPALQEIIQSLQDMIESKIASIVHFESVVDKLKLYAKSTGKIEVL